MNKLSRSVQAITKSPFLWGALGSAGFYALIHAGPLDMPFINRQFADLIKHYFTHHPVEYMETVMFSIGLAALLIKAFDTVAQRASLGESLLGSVPRTANPADKCGALLSRLDRLPGRHQGEYYVCRLRAALEHIRHRGSADTLDDELKYLSDVDASRLHAGYGQFRVIVWAIPILGFLGTVIGITMMLTGAAELANGPDQSAMFKIFEGLGLKFDTTALALTLSIILMFVHFYVEHGENSLLEQVDRRVQQELAGRFAAVPAGGDGQVAMRHLAEMMLQNSEVLLRRQAELWQASVESAAPALGPNVRRGERKSEGGHVGRNGRTGRAGRRVGAGRGRRGRSHPTGRCPERQPGRPGRREALRADRVEPGGGGQHAQRPAGRDGPCRTDQAGIRPTHGPRGMKAWRTQRRSPKQDGPGISLFPFLAVLICTMGVLVPLLLAITRTARMQAGAAALGEIGRARGGTQNPAGRRRNGEASN